MAFSPSPSVKSATTPAPSRCSGTGAARPRLSPGPSKRAPCASEVALVSGAGVVEGGTALQMKGHRPRTTRTLRISSSGTVPVPPTGM